MAPFLPHDGAVFGALPLWATRLGLRRLCLDLVNVVGGIGGTNAVDERRTSTDRHARRRLQYMKETAVASLGEPPRLTPSGGDTRMK